MKTAKNMRIGMGLVAAALSCICSLTVFAATDNQKKSAEAHHKIQFETAENPAPRPKAESTDESLKASVDRLQNDRNLDSLRERIVAKEQHAETLNARLIEITERETALQGRLAVVEHQLIPGNIEKLLAGVGSTKPEELRETVRRALVKEREGLQTQLQLLDRERGRILTSLATTDATIESLRMELAAATLAEMR